MKRSQTKVIVGFFLIFINAVIIKPKFPISINIIIIKRIFQFFINVIIILRFKFILKPPPLQHKIKLQRRHFYE